jgi:hypothetical protein
LTFVSPPSAVMIADVLRTGVAVTMWLGWAGAALGLVILLFAPRNR